MPTEISAIVQQAEPGGELACRALDHRFEDDGVVLERGVVSYYAIRALPHAATLGSWLAMIDRAAQDDLRRGRITTFHLPSLRLVGDGGARLPGTPVSAGARRARYAIEPPSTVYSAPLT